MGQQPQPLPGILGAWEPAGTTLPWLCAGLGLQQGPRADGHGQLMGRRHRSPSCILTEAPIPHLCLLPLWDPSHLTSFTASLYFFSSSVALAGAGAAVVWFPSVVSLSMVPLVP